MSDGEAGEGEDLKMSTEVKSPLLKDGLSCPECRSTSIAHFNLKFQESTHRTMCRDCKTMVSGESFEETDNPFHWAR